MTDSLAESISTNKKIDVSLGNTYLWQEWYREKDILIEQSIICTYQFHQPLNSNNGDMKLANAIIQFHKVNGYNIPHNSYILTGLGSTQVIISLLYTLRDIYGILNVWEKTPYFASHKDMVDITGNRWKSMNPPTFPNLDVEIVTSPCNPDGSIRLPETDAKIVIWDAVYAWSWYGVSQSLLLSKMKEACKDKILIPIFSCSKSIGLAGQRVGYAIIDDSVYNQLSTPDLDFISIYQSYNYSTTLGTCRSGEGTCRTILNSYKVFPEIKEELERRYDLLHKKFSIIEGLQILSPKGFPYMWLYLKDVDLYNEFLKRGIQGISGTLFGVTNEYVRISLYISSATFNSLMNVQFL